MTEHLQVIKERILLVLVMQVDVFNDYFIVTTMYR